MLDSLFTFPVILIDGDMEERKAKLGLPGEDSLEPIYAEASLPYHDFVGIRDRWLPTDESRAQAAEGNFEACEAIFAVSGSHLVPWSKEEFLKRFEAFAKDYSKKHDPKVITTKAELQALMDRMLEEDKEEENT